MALLFSGAEPFLQICRGYYEEQFCEIILNLDQWFWRKCLLKMFLYGALVALLFSRINLCNFGRGYQEEQFCEINLNLNKWFRRRCHLKTFLI